MRGHVNSKDTPPPVALVVDDEFLIAIEMEAILAAAGFEVMSAVSVSEAERLAAARAAHVAVLDFRMGDGAHHFARRLRDNGVPLLFCTGSMADEVHALFPGAVVISKPFIADALLESVRNLLAASVARASDADTADRTAPDPSGPAS